MKQIYQYSTLYIVVSLLLSIFPISHVQAQTSGSAMLRISPIIHSLQLSPGKTEHLILTLENLTDQPLPVQAQISGFDIGDEEGGMDLNSANQDSPLIDWIQLKTTDLILDPHSPRTVEATITVPTTVSVGGYYAMVLFTPLIPATDAQSPKVIPRIGALILANLGVPPEGSGDRYASIESFTLPAILEPGEASWLLRIKNISLNYFSAKPRLKLQPIIGTPLDIELPEKIVFPGKIRRWEQTSPVTPGLYQATLSVSVGNGVILNEERLIMVLNWKVILAVGIGMLILGVLLTKRHRIKKALKILLFNK